MSVVPSDNANGATVSSDPLDFAAFIVYLRRVRRPNETEDMQNFRESCQAHPEIVLKFVEEISPKDKPDWLQAVPTVVSLPDYSISIGTSAIRKVMKWCSSHPAGTDASLSMGVPSAPLQTPGELISRDEQEQEVKTFSSVEELLRLRERRDGGPKLAQA